VTATVRTFPEPSVATAVNTLAPLVSVTLRLQLAVLLPVAVPPFAVAPLTVTLVMPLPPEPLSVAVPDNVMVDALTVWPDVWLVIESPGAVVSVPEPLVTVSVDVRTFPAPSVATTLNVFAPIESETFRLQFAVLLPEAVPPVAVAPFTVTLVIPLLPVPPSLAVPASVMLDVVTVWPDVWLEIASEGAAVSLPLP